MPSHLYIASFLSKYPGPNLRFQKISATRLLQYLNCYRKSELRQSPCKFGNGCLLPNHLVLTIDRSYRRRDDELDRSQSGSRNGKMKRYGKRVNL
jgi:hypothetical protein